MNDFISLYPNDTNIIKEHKNNLNNNKIILFILIKTVIIDNSPIKDDNNILYLFIFIFNISEQVVNNM